MPTDIAFARAARVMGRIALAGLLPLSSGCAAGTDAAGDGPEPLPDDTYRQVVEQGTDPALVYVIEVAGFEAATQSAGVVGGSDYAVTYVPTDPPLTSQIYLEVRAGSYDEARCERDPLRGTDDAYSTLVESCEADASGWYRSGDDWHEYVARHAGHHLTVGAPPAVERQVLIEAALGARRQDGSTPSSSTPATPMQSPSTRGDLPGTGDGAPVDPHGSDVPSG
jgi:hypothetical protein